MRLCMDVCFSMCVCVCVHAPVCFAAEKEKQREKELVFQGWKFKWNWKLSGHDCLVVPMLCQKTRDRKSNYSFLPHAHKTRVKTRWKMASQTSWYCVSCLSSQMKWMYPLLPLSSSPLLALSCFSGLLGTSITLWWMTLRIISVLTTLTVQCQQFILRLTPQGRMICFNRTLLISAGPIKKALLESFFHENITVSIFLGWFQRPEHVQFEKAFAFSRGQRSERSGKRKYTLVSRIIQKNDLSITFLD